MTKRSDDEIFVEICGLAEKDFVADPQKIFDLVGEMEEPAGYGKNFTLSILYDYTKKGMMKKEEFVRGVRAICTGEVEQSVEKKRKEKRAKKRDLKKKQKVTGRIKVVCNLDGQVYHNNKGRFHKLADKFNLTRKGGWNKELNAAILSWTSKDQEESINGFFLRRGDVTTKATLTWRGETKTLLVEEFVQVCRDLNGELDDAELRHRAAQSRLFEF